jgi:hypothetical protein
VTFSLAWGLTGGITVIYYQHQTSVPELVEYIGDLASELAQMAKAANCTPLAYHLEMAMLEAERLSQDPQFALSVPSPH